MSSELTKADYRQLGDLLDELAGYLDSAIETSVLPGERWPRDSVDRAGVAQDRRDLRIAERLLKKVRALE